MAGSGMTGNIPVAPLSPLGVFEQAPDHPALLVRSQGLSVLTIGAGSIENRLSLGAFVHLSWQDTRPLQWKSLTRGHEAVMAICQPEHIVCIVEDHHRRQRLWA